MREYIRKLWLRNLLSLTILGIFCFGFFWAGAAWGNTPQETKMLGQKYEQYVKARPATTTTTTTTAPPVKPVITAPKAPTTTSAPVAPQGEIQQYIYDQAVASGLDPQRMLRIAKCESGYNPNSINKNYYAGGGNPSGIYQYLPETWNRISSRSGLGVGNVFDWQQNVRVTMWAFANGYGGEWACR